MNRNIRFVLILLIVILVGVLVVNTLPGEYPNWEKTVNPNSEWVTSRPDSSFGQKTVSPDSSWNTKQP